MENDFDFNRGMAIRCCRKRDADSIQCQDRVSEASLDKVVCVREGEEKETEEALEVNRDANLKSNR